MQHASCTDLSDPVRNQKVKCTGRRALQIQSSNQVRCGEEKNRTLEPTA